MRDDMRKIIKIVTLFVAIIAVLAQQNIALAEQFVFDDVDYLKSENIRLICDGKQIEFDVEPQIVNGRTLVPIRAIFETVGLAVEWDTESKTVKGQSDDESNSIKFTIGSNKTIVNNEEKVLDVPACIIDGRTMVPLRFLSENMGYNVVWVGESNLILISKKDVAEWRPERYETKDAIIKYENMYVNGEKTLQVRFKQYPQNVIALVNGREITREAYDIEMAVHRYYFGEEDYCLEYEELSDNVIYAYEGDIVLQRMIEDAVMLYAAEKYGISMSDEEFEKRKAEYLDLSSFTEDERDFYTSNKHIEEHMVNKYSNLNIMKEYYEQKDGGNTPSDEELRQYVEEYKPGQTIWSRHILVKTEEEAKEALKRLRDGEEFSSLAEELNIDSSKKYGGDLGILRYEEITKPYSDVAFSMEIGEISEPVKTKFGYHIIELLDKFSEEITVENSRDKAIRAYDDYKFFELNNKLVKEAEVIIKEN
jgi:foldase protein PrsA